MTAQMTAQNVHRVLHSGLLCVMFAQIGASLDDGAGFCTGFCVMVVVDVFNA